MLGIRGGVGIRDPESRMSQVLLVRRGTVTSANTMEDGLLSGFSQPIKSDAFIQRHQERLLAGKSRL